ncbi:MAG: hypothetical protein ACRCV3_06010 [Desulfovibrionaceae bacterium]
MLIVYTPKERLLKAESIFVTGSSFPELLCAVKVHSLERRFGYNPSLSSLYERIKEKPFLILCVKAIEKVR